MDDDWRTEEDEDMDLELENQSLEDELELKGGMAFSMSEDVDPRVRNRFLKNVGLYEDLDAGPKKKLRELFPPDFEFPPVNKLSKRELRRKLDDIQEVLGEHGVQFGFAEGVPDELIYAHLVGETLDELEVFAEEGHGFSLVLDGCSGGCETCFQKEYCEAGKEMLAEDGATQRKGGKRAEEEGEDEEGEEEQEQQDEYDGGQVEDEESCRSS